MKKAAGIFSQKGHCHEESPMIMGILNLTPDSFYDGGKYTHDTEAAIACGLQMEEDGAAIIDVGAESTHPGARSISAEEEIARLSPVVPELARKLTIPISLDTQKPEVARWGLEQGVRIINDVGGFRLPGMVAVVGEFKAAVIVMHMRGEPESMQIDPHYENVLAEIGRFLQQKIEALHEAGIEDIAIDPGIGFGKTIEHNLLILNHLPYFCALGPVVIGTSRKSFIGKINNATENDRLAGSLASNVWAYLNGAQVLRVHDVKEMRQAIDIIQAIEKMNELNRRENLAARAIAHPLNQVEGTPKCS
jgi:dihydropteroate synthase